MMTRKATILLAGAAIACMAVLSGCSKGTFGYGGKTIRFTTTSGGAQTTKTEYGDDYKDEETNITKQALNWKKGDLITIASPQAIVLDGVNAGENASNYVVKDNPTSGVPSTARVDNEGTNGLTWTDDVKQFDFYAVYPKVAEDISKSGIKLTKDGEVTATIPNQQNLFGQPSPKEKEGITYNVYDPNMDYAYMTAATEGVEPSDKANAVSLTFNPAFTAFEFNVSSQDDEAIQLTSFELLSPKPSATEDAPDKIAGTFKMNAGNLGSVNVTAGTNSITADLSSTPAIDGEKGLSFTVFALPVENTQALRLRFTSKDGTGSKTSWVDMKYSDNIDENGEYYADKHGQPVVFEAGHKYRINMLKLPSSQWKIIIVPDFEEWDAETEEVVIYI